MENKKWLIDGNRLKEKAVSLLFPTHMESCGHLSDPVQAVTVSTIEDMVYREGVEVIPCKSCKHSRQTAWYSAKLRCTHPSHMNSQVPYEVPQEHFCGYGERREGE